MKKKICIFTGYFPLQQGGAEYQAFLIAESLDKKKFDVFFVMFGHIEKVIHTQDGYKVYSIKTHNFLYKYGHPFFLYYFKIKKILSNEKPDLIYRRMGYAIPGLLALIKKKIKFQVIWACAHMQELEKFKVQNLRYFLNLFDNFLRIYGIKKADVILVQTNEQKNLLYRNFQRGSLLFPNLHPVPTEAINKKENPIQIVWIANYKKWKQPDIFIRLADHFQDYSNVKFIMIGRLNQSKLSLSVRNQIKKLNNLELKGELPIKEVNTILAESHIFINTSLSEGFPNTFIQAWMRKVPVISLNVDPDNMIKDNGIGFHSKTETQLIKDTKTLIKNKTLWAEMSESAQEFSLKNFSAKNLEKIRELFGSLI